MLSIYLTFRAYQPGYDYRVHAYKKNVLEKNSFKHKAAALNFIIFYPNKINSEK